MQLNQINKDIIATWSQKGAVVVCQFFSERQAKLEFVGKKSGKQESMEYTEASAGLIERPGVPVKIESFPARGSKPEPFGLAVGAMFIAVVTGAEEVRGVLRYRVGDWKEISPNGAVESGGKESGAATKPLVGKVG